MSAPFSIEGFARLFEGEGTIDLCQSGNGGWRVRMQIGMTDEDVIEAVRAQFGGTTHSRDYPRRPTWSRCYIWQLNGRPAEKLAHAILPYMFARRTAQVERALAGLDSQGRRVGIDR